MCVCVKCNKPIKCGTEHTWIMPNVTPMFYDLCDDCNVDAQLMVLDWIDRKE